MLFGEFSFSSTTEEFLAKLLSVLLLLMVAFLFIGIVRSIVKLKVPNLFMLLWLLLSLLSLLYFRHTYSYSPNQDFRYIFPSIIPFIYFYLTGIDFFIKRKLMTLGILAYILAFLFVLATTFLFHYPIGKLIRFIEKRGNDHHEPNRSKHRPHGGPWHRFACLAKMA